MVAVLNGENITMMSEDIKVPNEIPTDLNSLRDLIHDEMSSAVADIERRYGQARELEQTALFGTARSIHAEDLNINRHIIEGYTLTANSPIAGSIAWTAVHVVYLGVDYLITDASTALKYSWFVKPGSGTSATLTSSNTIPVLGINDALIFINNAGTPISALSSSISYAFGPDVIGSTQIANGAVTSGKTDFYSDIVNSIITAQSAADLAQATADGSVTTYFQVAAPWATGDATAGGASNPSSKTGDVWYDSDDGQAYRWSGPGGTPVNTWVTISDSDIGAALSAANAAQTTANSRITTFFAVLASPPSALAIGDLWVVSDQNNQVRRATAIGTASWSTLLIGDAAISGVGGAKVGTGISATNVTTGTLTGSLVGTGISATNVTTGTILAARVGAGVSAVSLVSATGTLAAANVGAGVAGAALGSATGTLAAANVGAGVAGAALGSATGTLPAANVGAGVAGAALGSATGTINSAQIGSNAVTPAKINAAFHLLY